MPREIPEFFVDHIQIQSGPGGATLTLGAAVPVSLGSGPPRIHCVVRMDLIQAKVLAIQLKRNLKHHEGEHGIVSLSPRQMEALGISEHDDWI